MRLLYRLFPTSTLLAKFKISCIYKKNQEDLTLEDLFHYYVSRTLLQFKESARYFSNEDPIGKCYSGKISSSKEQVKWLIKRIKLYGFKTKIYDCPRH